MRAAYRRCSVGAIIHSQPKNLDGVKALAAKGGMVRIASQPEQQSSQCRHHFSTLIVTVRLNL